MTLDNDAMDKIYAAVDLKMKEDLVTLSTARDKAIAAANAKYDRGFAKIHAEYKKGVYEASVSEIRKQMKPELSRISEEFSTEVAAHYHEQVMKL